MRTARNQSKTAKCLIALCLALSYLTAPGQESLIFGPLFGDFNLTLSSGRRIEILGPLFYRQHEDTAKTWALPPLFSNWEDPAVEAREYDFVYPLLTYDRFGEQYRWQLGQLLSFAGGATQVEKDRNRFTLYPLIFIERSTLPEENYTAILPFYGYLRNRFGRDEIFTVMWPLYSTTRKKDVITHNYPYPFFHLRHGNKLEGWQLWPFYGEEEKLVTTSTNGFGDVEMIPGHRRRFVLWPIHFNQYNGLGSTNEQHQYGILPAYSILRSPLRDSTTVLWPFFTVIDDREKKYHEWQGPWPFVDIARGEGKTITRFWPIFSHAHSDILESRTYLWPVYRYNAIKAPEFERERRRILYFLYSDAKEKNPETHQTRRRVDVWPLFTRNRDWNGNTRLQVLAPLEPILPANKSITRNYSPLWSIWRAEKNPGTGASSQSLLWNTWRREVTPEHKKTSLLFGLFQYESGSAGARMRLFYLPVKGGKPKAAEGEG